MIVGAVNGRTDTFFHIAMLSMQYNLNKLEAQWGNKPEENNLFPLYSGVN
jgi:hypothetical protein